MPAIPKPVIVADLVVKTVHGRRRNRFYYQEDGARAWIFQDVAKVADAVKANFEDVYAAVMSSLNSVEKCEVKILTGGDEFEDTSTSAPTEGEIEVLAGEGEGDGDSMPDEVTLNLRVQTGLVGRSRRGRRFVSGLAEAVQTSGIIEEDFANACKAIAAKVADSIDVTTLGVEGGETAVLYARHWNRKTNTLDAIIGCRAMGSVGTRRDRRRPLQFEPLV